MRRLSYGIFLLCMLLTACTERLDVWDGPVIELTLQCDEPVPTRAGTDGTKDGVDRYNENLIGPVDFFFYPGDTPDRTADATFHVRVESGKRYSDVFRIELTSEDVNQRIFPSSPQDIRKATVFTVVNWHGSLVADETSLAGTSLETLEAILTTTDFVSPADYKQADFLMSGTTVINLRGRSQIMAATGAVDLVRYACKMTVGLNVASRIELPSGEVWKPMLDGTEIYLVNAVHTVTLGGMDPEPDYFSYSSSRRRFVSKDALGNLTPLVGFDGYYYDTYPMYMYPQHWTYGSDQGYDREPYLKLVVPWVRQEENGFSSMQKQLYYKIVMPDDPREGYRRKFVRNNWYHMNIEVGILGAETDEASVTVPGTCFMVYWQDKDFIVKKAEIGSARYLSVEKDSYVLNNINTVDMAYTTSHPVVIKDGTIRVTRRYYGTKTSGEDLGGVIRKAGSNDIYPPDTYYLEYDEAHRRAMNDGEDWFGNTGTAIRYTHVLQNDYTLTSFEYSPYNVSFTIVHEDRPDDTQYARDIQLVQYPAIYIEATRNSDDTFVYVGHDVDGRPDNWNKKIHTSDHWGYVYVDNEQIVRPDIHSNIIDEQFMDYWRSLGYDYADEEEYHWRVVWYTGGTLDMFKINVTVLPSNSQFVIGDPRTLEIDNLRNSDNNPDNDFHTAPALYDGATDRSLKYYYPAESSDRTVNMLAPSYRFTSKCNGIEFGDLTLDQAKWRCATYQEDGFPAGRWRLPTQGEIHFVAMLSANGAFEPLFTSNQNYWSANGGVRVSTGNVSSVSPSKALTRCVYDSWYWGDGQQENREQFVWGDRER